MFKITGSYRMQSWWSDMVRKDRIYRRITKIIKPKEYLVMSNEELYDCIKVTLFTDEANDSRKFEHQNYTEYPEHMMYA